MPDRSERVDVTADWFPVAPTVAQGALDAFVAIRGTAILNRADCPRWSAFFAHWSQHIIALRSSLGRTPLIGVCGSQGSGKSTTTKILAGDLQQRGIRAVVLSIDDFYLTRAERLALAQSQHPLLAERGMPGTHDLSLLNDAIERLLSGQPLRLPAFDKGIDDRLPESQWRRVSGADAVLLEGWCVGCPPQAASALDPAINERERNEDPDGQWRCFVNRQLEINYRELWQRLDEMHLLRAPSFEQVFVWRDQQEQANRDRDAARAMSSEQVRHYVTLFERLTRHMLATLPTSAELLFGLDQSHRVETVSLKRS